LSFKPQGARGERSWLLVEIVFLYLIILALIWIIFPLGSFILNLGILLLILGAVSLSSIYHHKTLKDIGIRWDNFYGSLKQVGSFTSIMIIPLLVMGIFYKSIHFTCRIIPDFLVYLVWAFLQQYTFQTFFNLRFSELFDQKIYGVIFTAVIFSSVHYPNPFLMPATLLLGFFWFWFYLERPNLFALSLCHALLGTVAKYTLPLAISGNLKVGTLYLFHR
jgi:hypothetical protein